MSIRFYRISRLLARLLGVALIVSSVGCAVTPQTPVNNRAYWSKQADFYYSNERWVSAEKPCIKLTQIEPVTAYDWFRLGNVYGYTDRPRMAFEVYEKAIALAPEQSEMRYNQAVTLLRLAVEEFGWAIMLGDSERIKQQITELLEELTPQFEKL